MLNLFLLTAGTWTAISFLFVWCVGAAFPPHDIQLRQTCLCCIDAAGLDVYAPAKGRASLARRVTGRA